MSGETRVFANSLMVFIRDDGLVSIPEIGKADALVENFRDSLPKVVTSCDASASNNTGNYLPGVLTER